MFEVTKKEFNLHNYIMFSSKKLPFYFTTLAIVIGASFVADKFKKYFEDEDDEYKLIRQYLLNDSPLYGSNRPKLWIHSEYGLNARKWKSFQSRNSTDLNQPYLNLTIQSIINTCGDHFHICLIDDDSFSKLIPDWSFDMDKVADPHKSHYRDVGLISLLYYYGGVVVPNSMISHANLQDLYENSMRQKKPILGEEVNKSLNLLKHSKEPSFIPSVRFMASPKQNEHTKQLKDYANDLFKNGHFTHEHEFTNKIGHYCVDMEKNNQLMCIDGYLLGIKTKHGKPVILDDLMEERPIDFHSAMLGIIIPSKELLVRTKYQWFVVLPEEQVVTTNACLSKYLFNAVNTSENDNMMVNNNHSVVSI